MDHHHDHFQQENIKQDFLAVKTDQFARKSGSTVFRSCPSFFEQNHPITGDSITAIDKGIRRASSIGDHSELCQSVVKPVSVLALPSNIATNEMINRKRLRSDDVQIRITGVSFDRSSEDDDDASASQQHVSLPVISSSSDLSKSNSEVSDGGDVKTVPLTVPTPIRPRSVSMPSFDFIDDCSADMQNGKYVEPEDVHVHIGASWNPFESRLSHNTSALAKPWSLNEVLLNDSDFDDEKGNDLQFEEGDPENGTRVTPLLTSQTPSDVPIQIETPPAVLLSAEGVPISSIPVPVFNDVESYSAPTSPNYRSAGNSDVRDFLQMNSAVSSPGQHISLEEALADPSVTATTVVHVNLPESHHNPQQANATPIANSSSNAGGGVGSVSNWTADDVAIFAQQPSPSTATFFPPNAATSTSVLKKNKKDKTRRTSNIFGIGASKSKKSKEEMKRCQQSHSFVSVSFSNTAPCQICGKPLAHKPASHCQNCLLTCHENSCLDQIEVCPFSSSSTNWNNNNLGLTNWNSNNCGLSNSRLSRSMRVVGDGHHTFPATQTFSGLPSSVGGHPPSGTGTPVLPSVIIDKMIAEHGYAADNVPDAAMLGLLPVVDPKLQPLKRLSVPSSFETQTNTLSGAQSESNLTASSPASSRRPISPGNFSRWKYVADKLLNKPGSAVEPQTESDGDETGVGNATSNIGSTTVNSTENPDVKDVLPYARLLDFDPELKLATPEPEAWSMMQDKEYLSTLSEKEIKRQDIIHELIQTEKNHCAVLLIIEQIYIRGLRYELQWPETEIQKFFPAFLDILDVHMKFFRQLRARQQQSRYVDVIGDVLIDQFDGERGDRMKRAYGAFCSHHKEASQIYKIKLQKDRRFAAFDMKCVEKLKCHTSRFDIPSCILLVTQRISKYRLLIESIYNKTDEESADKASVGRAFQHVKEVLTWVDGSIGAEERRKRLNEIYRAMDSKSSTLINGEEWKKHQLFDRALICDGPVQFRKASGKLVDIQALLLSDCMVFLQENNQKFSFAHVDDKPPVVPLNRVIIRPKAERSGIPEKSLFLISSGVINARAEMYELICNNVKECEKWRTEIQAACLTLRQQEEALAAAVFTQELNVDDEQVQKLRDVISVCQAKDRNVTRLCEDKCDLLREAIDCLGIPRWRMNLQPLPSEVITEDNLAFDTMQSIVNAALAESSKLLLQPSQSTNLQCNSMSTSCDNIAINPAVLSPPPTSTAPVMLTFTQAETSPAPRRAETFGGFDGNKEANGSNAAVAVANRSTSMKGPGRNRRPASILGGMNPKNDKSSQLSNDKSSSTSISASRDSCVTADSSSSAVSSSPASGGSPRTSTLLNSEDLGQVSNAQLPSVLQLHWYLNQILDGLARQSTAYESLRAKYAESQQRLAALESRDKKVNKHSAQLEELRSLQEAFMKEKNQFNSERENDNQWVKQKRQEIDKDTAKLKADKEDMEKQRNAMFAQCEKLRENGLDVILSSQAPYVQIFPSSKPLSNSISIPTPPSLSSFANDSLNNRPGSTNPLYPTLGLLPSRESSFTMSSPISPVKGHSFIDSANQSSLPPRPPLSSSHSLNQIKVPVNAIPVPSPIIPPPPVPARNSTASSPSGAAFDVVNSANSRLRPPATANTNGSTTNPVELKQIIPNSLAGNWKGSMESLHKKTEAAKEKFRSFYDGHGQDKLDSLPPHSSLPRQGKPPTVRAASEAKLGISNLMHLSEKTSLVNGNSAAASVGLFLPMEKEKGGGREKEKDSKKKSSDKKRSFL